MTTSHRLPDWGFTPNKLDEAVRRIVETSDPLAIILFGSRARGDHRPDSDVDLAVILDVPQEEVRRRLPNAVLGGIRMPIDMIVVSREKYDEHRPWVGSIFNYIDREGISLYDRQHSKRASSNAFEVGVRRRVRPHPAVA